MSPLTFQDQDPEVISNLNRQDTPKTRTAIEYARGLAVGVATTLALVGTEVAEANILVVPPGVNSLNISGNFYGTVSTGGEATYTIYNADGVEFTGESFLGTPTAGGIYKVILNAMRETGEKFDMEILFDGGLRFTGPQSFEATGSPFLNQSKLLGGINPSSQNIPLVQASWDRDGIGEAIVYNGNAYINAVPEPGTTALLLAGLAGVAGGVAARRRKAGSPSSTPTETAPTPEGATTE